MSGRFACGALLLAAIATPPVWGAVEPRFDSLAKQAAAARNQKRAPDAIRLYRQAVQLRPQWAEGWWYIGALQLEQKQYRDAARALTRFLRLSPKSAPGWALLGLANFNLEKYREALDALTLARAFGLPAGDELGKTARYHRAILEIHFGNFEAAFDELKRFPFLSVETPAVIEAIGIAGLRLPILPGQLPADQREMVLKTGRAVYDCWAVRIADADAEFSDLILTYPDNPHLRYLYGAFLLESRRDDGLRELNKCLELDPKYTPAMLQIAFAYLKWGEPAKGLPYAENAVRLAPHSFVGRHALGRLLVDAGKLEQGIRELETAAQLAPDQPQVRFALAAAYAKAGRDADAARERAEFQKLDQLSRADDTK
jgi:predicted Zn-dependent protease